ncbi:glycosyl hydrolase family 28-related protein [Paenibacillus hodogayensis]|uniref:Glycosyl hydrolase family 28-related protein n=1 Tax=Paenibacillus hodogayensis TaxID=279208 RepID=A0ABV5VPB8_9BACL
MESGGNGTVKAAGRQEAGQSVKTASSDSDGIAEQKWTRRRLLASIGAAGAAAAVYGATSGIVNAGDGRSVSEAVYGGCGCSGPAGAGGLVKTTIAGLRANASPSADVLYYVTDPGLEGHFYYDASDTATADNTGLVLVSASGARFKRIVESDRYSVKWFGAKGDGATDDMDSIQAAIDVVYALGGGTVFFPKGTYSVSPLLSTRRIVPKSNVHLLGEGTNSVIKVKDDAGDYWTIIGNFQTWPKVSNVSIRGLRFDQNPSGNTTCSIDHRRTDYYWTQFCISLFDYENIEVSDCTFDPICGWNTVVLNNPQSKNAVVRNCTFNFVHARGFDGYDNSAVYMNGKSHTVTNCRFYAAPGEKAVGAIETHTGQSVVSNNISDGYVTGVHIQASETSGEHADMTVTGNTFTNAAHAIQFWPYKEHSLKNVTVAGNTISLANAQKQGTMMVGIGAFPGSLPPDFTGMFENITITGNTITCEEEFVKRTNLLEGFCYGIGFVRDTSVNNVIISDNIIKNAPVAAIHIGNTSKVGTMSNLRITGNLIVNAGHYPAANETYKAAILLRSTVAGAKIAGNTIQETYGTSLGLYSIRLNAADGTFINVEVTDNLISSKQGGLWLDLHASVRTDEASARLKFASSALDDPLLETGTTYQSGTIVLAAGTAFTPGASPAGYRILSGGTFGALSGITATGSAGSYKVVVNDSALLKVGQWIKIAAGGQVRRINRIAGNELRVNAPLSAAVTAPSAVTYSSPVYEPFGRLGRLPALPDTSGLTVGELEGELNSLKQKLRDYGLIQP